MELPQIQKLKEKFAEHKDLQFVAIEINNDRVNAEKFIKKESLEFIFSEADRDFVKKYFNTAGYPNSFIIGKDLKIKAHHRGFRPGDEKKIAKELLAELK